MRFWTDTNSCVGAVVKPRKGIELKFLLSFV